MQKYTILILLVFLSACHYASFTDRPGVIVPKFPDAMCGKYQNVTKSKGVYDTTFITVNSNGIVYSDGSVNKAISLNDSMYSLSHLGDYYYMNVKESDSTGKNTYFVYPFEFNEKSVYVYILPYNNTTIKQMKKAGLGISTRMTGEYVMDNKAFKNYVEKRLKRKKAFKFNKIK